MKDAHNRCPCPKCGATKEHHAIWGYKEKIYCLSCGYEAKYDEWSRDGLVAKLADALDSKPSSLEE